MKQFNLEEYLKNPNRKVVTRDGSPVRIVCTDRKSYIDFPVVALVMDNEGKEYTENYRENGSWTWSGSQNNMDLFFAPEKKVGWVNIYYRTQAMICGLIYQSEERAKQEIDKDKPYITTTKIEWEE